MTAYQPLPSTQLFAIGEADLDRRKKYVDLGSDDIERIKSLAPLVAAQVDTFVEVFFSRFFSETVAFMSRPEAVAEAKQLMREHLIAMVSGEYGRDYVDQRIRLGLFYSKYGIEPRLFLGAYHYLMSAIGTEILARFASDTRNCFEHFISLKKLCFFDIGVICDVLVAERERIINLHREANAGLTVVNRRLEHARGEAEAANRELEAFSYSVAHDLRAPLRAIDGFSMALLEDYADKVDDEGKLHLRYVRESAQRMAQLIDGLLALSRLSRRELRRERVDLAKHARVIEIELRKCAPNHRVEFVVADDAITDGDPRMLMALLENLLGNAWKFTRDAPSPRVEFAVEDTGGERTFVVRDNGTGFDMAHAAKLFGAFQRLHGAQEFEGSGIGLATVQRIVNRHGGRIWAHAEIGNGAEFRFTLGSADSLEEAS